MCVNTHKLRNDICIPALLADGGVVVKIPFFNDMSKQKQAVEINMSAGGDNPAPARSKRATSQTPPLIMALRWNVIVSKVVQLLVYLFVIIHSEFVFFFF